MSSSKLEKLYLQLKEEILKLGESEEEIEEKLSLRFFCPDPGFQYVISVFFDLDLPVNNMLGKSICSIIVSKKGEEEVNGSINLGRKSIYMEGINGFRETTSYCTAIISGEYERNGIDLIDDRTISIEEEDLSLPPSMRNSSNRVVSTHSLSVKLIVSGTNLFIQEILDGVPSVFYNFLSNEVEEYKERLESLMALVLNIQRECFNI